MIISDSERTETVLPPSQYRYKVSLECSTKSVQPQITVYSDEPDIAMLKAVNLLELTCADLRKQGFRLGDFFDLEDNQK